MCSVPAIWVDSFSEEVKHRQAGSVLSWVTFLSVLFLYVLKDSEDIRVQVGKESGSCCDGRAEEKQALPLGGTRPLFTAVPSPWSGDNLLTECREDLYPKAWIWCLLFYSRGGTVRP